MAHAPGKVLEQTCQLCPLFCFYISSAPLCFYCMSQSILSNKYCSVDAIHKMGSYPIPREGRFVSTMNKLTAQELEGAIIFGDKSSTCDKYLGFLLDKILSDSNTTIDIPSFDELMVPCSTIENYNPQIVQTYPPIMSTSRSMIRPLSNGTGPLPSPLGHCWGLYPIPPRHRQDLFLMRHLWDPYPLLRHRQAKKFLHKRISSQHFSMQLHWPLGKKEVKIPSDAGWARIVHVVCLEMLKVLACSIVNPISFSSKSQMLSLTPSLG